MPTCIVGVFGFGSGRDDSIFGRCAPVMILRGEMGGYHAHQEKSYDTQYDYTLHDDLSQVFWYT